MPRRNTFISATSGTYHDHQQARRLLDSFVHRVRREFVSELSANPLPITGANPAMNGPTDNNDKDENGLYGPSESDIERFNREDSDYLHQRKREARSALWKLVAGGVFMLLVASMFLNVLLPAFSRTRHIDTGPERIAANVIRVLDGRTIGIEIDGVESIVRYIGVETPIFGNPWYEVAIAANTQWMLGQQVLIEADNQDADAEGRLLRYVWIDGAMVNLNLIASGLSEASTSGPNRRYGAIFDQVEQTARSQNLGIWTEIEAERSALLTIPVTPVHFNYMTVQPL